MTRCVEYMLTRRMPDDKGILKRQVNIKALYAFRTVRQSFPELEYRVSYLALARRGTKTAMLNIQKLIADDKCYETVRELRWPEGVRCAHCDSAQVTKQGRDTTQPYRQKYHCQRCGRYFDDLTGTVVAGHHPPLHTWILCL